MRHKTLEKLRNLYRHAKSAVGYGNKCEARDYYRKIIRICRSHGIERPEFYQSFGWRGQQQDQSRRNPLADGEAVFTHESKMFRRRRVMWEEDLFRAIAKYFDCRAYVNRHNNIKIAVGIAPQRRLCIDTYLHLYGKAIEEAKSYVDMLRESAKEKPNRYEAAQLKRSFYHGFAHAMTFRLEALSAALQSIVRYEAETQTQTASMVMYGGQLDAKKPAPQVGEVKTKMVMLYTHAYYAGISAGNFVALTDSLQLTEQTTLAKFREIENARAEQRRREKRIEEMRLIKNARGRGFRRGARDYRYEIIPAQPIETFSGVQQAFRFE